MRRKKERSRVESLRLIGAIDYTTSWGLSAEVLRAGSYPVLTGNGAGPSIRSRMRRIRNLPDPTRCRAPNPSGAFMAPRRLSAGKKDNSFEFGSRVIGPGRQESVEIPVAPLYNQTMIVVTPFIMNGVRPGPRLWVSGAIHGDELVGPAVIRE